MITLEVSVNGKRVCTAGAEDLSVLSAHVVASGKLGRKTVPPRPDDGTAEIHYHVGGLTARKDPSKDVHMRWKSVAPLKLGDTVQIKVVESRRADLAKSRTKAKKRSV